MFGNFLQVSNEESVNFSTLSVGQTVALPASAHTKGSWVTITGTPNTTDIVGFWIDITDTGASNTVSDATLDIAYGGAGSEQIVLADLLVGWKLPLGTTNAPMSHPFWIPLFVPANTTVRVRIQGSRTSVNCTCHFYAVLGTSLPMNRPFSQCDTYGVTSSTSRGVDVLVGNTGANGNWIQITSSTTRNHGFLLLSAGNQNATSSIFHNFLFDIAVGGAGAEVPIMENISMQQQTLEANWISPWAGQYRSIPAGTRLSVRGRSHTSSPPSPCIALHGFS